MAKPKKKKRTGVDYGLKSRCYLSTEQTLWCEDMLDRATKFWNILVYEQCRPLWIRNSEIREIQNTKKPKLEKLLNKLEVYYLEMGKNTKQVESLLKKHKNKFYNRIEQKWDNENPIFWICWFQFSSVFKEWGFEKLKDDWLDIKQHAKELYGDDFDKWYAAPRNRTMMCIAGDSLYQYGTTKPYNDALESIGLPSSIALGVVKSIHETWSLVRMAPRRPHPENKKIILPPFINRKGLPRTKNDKKGKRSKLTSIRFDSGNANAITKQFPSKVGLYPIKIQGCATPIDVKFHRVDPDIEKVCYYTLTKEGEDWFFSLNINSNKVIPKTQSKLPVGVDVGCTTLITATDGDGKTFTMQRTQKVLERLTTLLARRDRQQSHVSRKGRNRDVKKNPSKNYLRAKTELNQIQKKINRINSNLRHHVSNVLTKKYGFIIVEDLKVVKMVKNEGNRKKLLNKNILAQGWGEIMNSLKYKGANRGVVLHKVNPAYTSQTCSECGHCEKGNRKTQADFLCKCCGHTENADVNASKNILKIGLQEIEENMNEKDIDKLVA